MSGVVIRLERPEQNPVAVGRVPSVFIGRGSRGVCHAINLAQGRDDVVAQIAHLEVFQGHARRFPDVNRGNLLLYDTDHNCVTLEAKRDLVPVVRQRLFVADKRRGSVVRAT